MIDQLPPDSYDDLPYPSLSYAQTHPDRLASMATLLGLEPAPVERCRVLDVGCAVGGNIIPMAYALPNSEFVGIDYSGRQIDIGHGKALVRHDDLVGNAHPHGPASHDNLADILSRAFR